MCLKIIRLMAVLAFLFLVFTAPANALELELGAGLTLSGDDDVFIENGGRTDIAVLRLRQKITRDGRVYVYYEHLSRLNVKDEGTDFLGLVVNFELWRFFK